MNGKQAIIDKILADAKGQAESILAEAKDKCAEIANSADSGASEIIAAAKDKAAKDEAAYVDNARIVANLDCKRELLSERARLLDEAIEGAAKSLRANSKLYAKVLTDMLARCAEDGDEIAYDEADEGVFTAAFLKKLSTACGTKLKYHAKRVSLPLGGVVLKGKGCDKSLSLKDELTSALRGGEIQVASVLFGEDK